MSPPIRLNINFEQSLVFSIVTLIGIGLRLAVWYWRQERAQRRPWYRAVLAPCVTAALVAALLFSPNAIWNAGHQLSPPFVPRGTAPREFKSVLLRWLDHHHKAGSNEKIPIIFVAAQGGGMYAGLHAALFLARLHDSSPNFKRHLFLISGVSGGSIGSVVFVGASAFGRDAKLPEQKCRVPGRGEFAIGTEGSAGAIVRCYFRHDLLSPIVGRLLFRDLLMLGWPSGYWPLSPYKDRAARFQAQMSEAWLHTIHQFRDANHPIDYGIAGLFERSATAADGGSKFPDGPLLLMNATIVEDGSRVVIGPPLTLEKTRLQWWHEVAPAVPLSLGEAAALSARFPWMLPAATARLSDRQIRIVDGGYTENSGLATISQILDEIKSECEHNVVEKKTDTNGDITSRFRISCHVITFGHRFPRFVGYFDGASFGEALSPFRAMMNVRMQRAEDALRDLKRDRPWLDVINVYLGNDGFEPPLGFTLSEKTIVMIESRAGGGMVKAASEANKWEGKCTVALSNTAARRVRALVDRSERDRQRWRASLPSLSKWRERWCRKRSSDAVAPP